MNILWCCEWFYKHFVSYIWLPLRYNVYCHVNRWQRAFKSRRKYFGSFSYFVYFDSLCNQSSQFL